MRKLMLVTVGLATLAITGLAVGKAIDGAKGVKSVAGTFTATTVASSQTRTCTTADGKTIAVTNATYTGTASGDPDLAGPVRLDARSTIDTTDGLGVVEGRLRIDVSSGGDTVARFQGVYDHGNLAGLAAGHVHEPHGKLVANFSAAFSTSGGFTGGKIGGSSGGSAVELAPGRCQPTQAQAGPKNDEDEDHKGKSEARGTVSALSQTSITVGGLTCMVPQSLAAQLNGALKVGDKAEIRCAQVNGQTTLVRFEEKH